MFAYAGRIDNLKELKRSQGSTEPFVEPIRFASSQVSLSLSRARSFSLPVHGQELERCAEKLAADIILHQLRSNGSGTNLLSFPEFSLFGGQVL